MHCTPGLCCSAWLFGRTAMITVHIFTMTAAAIHFTSIRLELIWLEDSRHKWAPHPQRRCEFFPNIKVFCVESHFFVPNAHFMHHFTAFLCRSQQNRHTRTHTHRVHKLFTFIYVNWAYQALSFKYSSATKYYFPRNTDAYTLASNKYIQSDRANFHTTNIVLYFAHK